MAKRFLSNIRINDAYTFPASDGTNNQVIKTDGSGNLSFGQLATDSASVMYKDTFTGDGSTTGFTLANALNDEVQSNIYIDGVYQSKSTYSVSGATVTFSTAPSSGHEIEVISTTGINSGPTAIYTDTFTANGSATAFTLGQTVHSENQTIVFLNGVYQFKGTYTLSGTTLTLDAAPSNGVSIEVMSIGSAYSGGDILYDHDFTSAGLMTSNGSGVYSITANNSANWNTAYGWGDHGLSAQDKTDIGNLSGTNTGDQDLSSYATQSYVGTQISNLVDSSPATLNTLNELAAALGDDPNFATTTANSIGTKLPLAGGTLTGALLIQQSSTSTGFTTEKTGGTGSFINLKDTAGSVFIGGVNSEFVIQTPSGSYSNKLTISNSGNATFTGEVTISAETQYLNFKKASTADLLSTIVSETDAGTGGKLRFLTKRNGDTQVNALILDDNQTATFSGMIMVNGDGIDIDNNDNLRLRFDNASVFKAGLQVATSTGDMITGSATDDFAIRSQSNMLFATGGSTEKMRITSGGYVGIGNTSGAGARTKLGVTFGVGGNAANLAESVSYAAIEMYPYRNSSTYGMFAGAMGTTSGYIQSANTNGTAAGAFSINPWGGGVGIGTNLPLTALHVNQSSDAQILVQGTNKMALHQDSAWNSNILLGCYYDGSNIVYGSTNRGAFKIVGLHDSTTQPQTLSIYGANGASPAGSTVTFNSVGFSQDEDGKVGIGTSEPASKFEVYGGSTGVNDVDRYVRFKASNGEKRFDFHIGGTGNASRLDMYQADGATYGARISSTGDSYVLNDFGIGTTSPARKLDVAGITKTSGLQIKRNYIEQQVDCAFTNGVANQNIDIRLGNISFWGYIEVEITGTYSNQSTPGKLTKIYAVGVNPNGTIYANNPRVADALGPIKNNIALGDFSWDSTNSTYRIRVSHIVSTGNGYTVKVKVFTHGSNGSNGASGILSNLTLSTVYTATSLSRNHVYYDDHVGINELNPAHKLDVKHGRIALTGLTQVTRNTSDPGYVALSGILPGYTANTYPTVESSTNDLHFAVGGVYTGYISHNTGFVDISDISLKENIEDIPDALAKVTAMRGRYFTWKNGLQNNEKQVGFIAQEVEEQLPEAVTAAAGGTKGVSYGKVTALLVNAIKEQQEIIESLKARIETLENN